MAAAAPAFAAASAAAFAAASAAAFLAASLIAWHAESQDGFTGVDGFDVVDPILEVGATELATIVSVASERFVEVPIELVPVV